MGAGPLQGIRVIDLTVWMSGAIGAMLLADLGADVIKVEGPTGDPVRRYVPIGATDAASAPGGVNYAYALCNRNKRQVTLDLRDQADRDKLHELIRGADVLITSMRADTLVALGIDEESVTSVNPAIVYARAGGLGHTGPRAADRCQDMLGMAYAGLLFTASPEPDEPFAPPGATNDVLTGTMIAFGVLAALLQRQHSGTRGDGAGIAAADGAVDAADPVRHRRQRAPGATAGQVATRAAQPGGEPVPVLGRALDRGRGGHRGRVGRFTEALGLTFADPETGGPRSYADVLAHAADVREELDRFFAKQPRVALAEPADGGRRLVHAGEHARRRHGGRPRQRQRLPEHARRRPADGGDAVYPVRVRGADPRRPAAGRG